MVVVASNLSRRWRQLPGWYWFQCRYDTVDTAVRRVACVQWWWYAARRDGRRNQGERVARVWVWVWVWMWVDGAGDETSDATSDATSDGDEHSRELLSDNCLWWFIRMKKIGNQETMMKRNTLHSYISIHTQTHTYITSYTIRVCSITSCPIPTIASIAAYPLHSVSCRTSPGSADRPLHSSPRCSSESHTEQ